MVGSVLRTKARPLESEDPGAPLPLPHSSNKLPRKSRLRDSVFSFSHRSVAPSWQSASAVVAHEWKLSQYLARKEEGKKKKRTQRALASQAGGNSQSGGRAKSGNHPRMWQQRKQSEQSLKTQTVETPTNAKLFLTSVNITFYFFHLIAWIL